MSLAYRISAYNRQRKWRIFQALIQPTASTSILDVGFSDQEYSATDNFLEKNYSHPEMITALGTDEPSEFTGRYPLVKAVRYDGKTFPWTDQSFDLCWSNAVIEHVGSRADQLMFIKEIKRVSRQAFITTPNRYFPIEVHTRTPLLHFLPKPLFDGYLRLIGKKWAAGNYMNLLSLAEIKELLRLAKIKDYRIIKNKFLGFTLDFIIVW
ncbi:class I SAM-dependent methyltransferase [Candidatus Falkowbacteria bacterium]|nr:class I SAM-dependent methyltransferase [Candidatus Falkowbacteria bacterium]